MSEELPEAPKPQGEGDEGGETRILNIDSLHLHGSDIDALRRLAETDVDLVRVLVEQRGQIDAREHASYRFGVVASAILVLGVLVALTFALVYLGVLLSLVLLAVMLAVALLIRVILTGEWSETSAIGAIVQSIVRMLGGTPKG